MKSAVPPFDDTVQLETMEPTEYFADSDTAPIVTTEREPPKSGPPLVIVADHSTMSEAGAPVIGKRKAYVTIAILLLINLLNYMDRFTVAGSYRNICFALKKKKNFLTLLGQ